MLCCAVQAVDQITVLLSDPESAGLKKDLSDFVEGFQAVVFNPKIVQSGGSVVGTARGAWHGAQHGAQHGGWERAAAAVMCPCGPRVHGTRRGVGVGRGW